MFSSLTTAQRRPLQRGVAQQGHLLAGKVRRDDDAGRDGEHAGPVRIGDAAGQQSFKDPRPGDAHLRDPRLGGRQAARTSLNCARSPPLLGENEPSNTAEPMVKASAPAARSVAIRSAELTLPATISCLSRPSAAPRRAHEVQRLGRGRAVGEQVDAGASSREKGDRMRGDVGGRAAELRRMTFGKAGEGVVGDARSGDGPQDRSASVPPSSRSTPISAATAAERRAASGEVLTTSM